MCTFCIVQEHGSITCRTMTCTATVQDFTPMGLKITCPKCGYVHNLQDSTSVDEIECRSCSQPIQLPPPKAKTQSRKNRDSHSRHTTPKQTPPKPIAWILGGILAAVFVGVVACCGGLALLSKKADDPNRDTTSGKPIRWGEAATFGELKISLKSA